MNNIKEILRERIGDSTQVAFAKKMGFSESYLCDVLKGRRDPGPSFLEALGLKKVVSYVPERRK